MKQQRATPEVHKFSKINMNWTNVKGCRLMRSKSVEYQPCSSSNVRYTSAFCQPTQIQTTRSPVNYYLCSFLNLKSQKIFTILFYSSSFLMADQSREIIFVCLNIFGGWCFWEGWGWGRDRMFEVLTLPSSTLCTCLFSSARSSGTAHLGLVRGIFLNQ